MHVALDYDNTYTLDSAMWNQIIFDLWNDDHSVWIVTMRHPTIDPIHLDDFALTYIAGIVYCDGRAKRTVCDEKSIKIDVWIDDSPETIDAGSSYTPEQLAEWRKLQVA